MAENHNGFHEYASNPETWLFEASKHIAVWKILSEHAEKLLIEGNYRVEEYAGCRNAALFHAGVAIENALKAHLIHHEPNIISNGKIDKQKLGNKGGHGLVWLASRVFPKLTDTEIQLLKKLEEYVFWAGKYSVPSNAETLFSREIKSSLRLTHYGENELLTKMYDTIVCSISNVVIESDT